MNRATCSEIRHINREGKVGYLMPKDDPAEGYARDLSGL